MGSESLSFNPDIPMDDPNSTPVILITGFGPFANYLENPAWLAIQALERRCRLDLPVNEYKFVFRKIPVEYEAVKSIMPKWWQELKPEVIIHVGTGLADGSLHVEKRSFNKGYCCKDMRSLVPCDNWCVDNGSSVLETEFDVEKIVQDVNANADQLGSLRPAKVSNNPGRFLCGFIYYQSLQCFSKRSLFIHVPPIDGKIITAENLARGLKLIIAFVVEQLKHKNKPIESYDRDISDSEAFQMTGHECGNDSIV